MISSFWNLCRACPSMPVEKQLHSEYRSTFQWHEYVGNRADPSSISQPQPQQAQQLAVVRQPHRSTQSQVLWASAAKAVVEDSSKRKRHPDILNRTSNGWTTKSTADEIRSQAVQLREHKQDPVGAGGGGGPRKSISMGTIRATENVPVHSHQKLSKLTSIANAGISQPSLEHRVPLDSNKETDTFEWTDREVKHDNINMHFSKDVDDDRGGDAQRLANREYLSEYKKRFRPFSQYEYVDGKFFKKKGDQEIGSPWFHEVIELRKKAGEYRHRGWGTELAPQHMAEVYNQQLWDQVSRRSSLAALALITTTTQRLSKEEKEKENVKRSHPTRSSSRPHTATPKHPLSDLRVDKQKDTETVQKKKPLDGTAAVNRAARAKARSQSAGPGGRSPRKSARQIVSSYGKPKEGPGGPGWKVQSDSGLVNSQTKPIQRHPRPTTLATSPRPKASSDKGHRDLNSKSVKQLQFDKSSADPALGCYEPVVKSPPEPTRVKSPEQAILMSPDPVNWTVPLDTSKSFTVTQNIREAPPSPRFRSGERFHGSDGRSIRHPLSGQHSSAGSTMASSPISARSAPVPIHSSGGHAAPTGLSSSAPGHNTIMERPLSSKPLSSIATSSSSVREPIVKPKDYLSGKIHHSDSSTANERDHGTGGGASGGGGLTRKSSIETKPHVRSQPHTVTAVNGIEEKKRIGNTSLHHQDSSEKRQSSMDKVSKDPHPRLHHTSTHSSSTGGSTKHSGGGGAGSTHHSSSSSSTGGSTKQSGGGGAGSTHHSSSSSATGSTTKSGIPSWKSDVPSSSSTISKSSSSSVPTSSIPTSSIPTSSISTSSIPTTSISTTSTVTTTTKPSSSATPTNSTIKPTVTTTTNTTSSSATPTNSTIKPTVTTTTNTTSSSATPTKSTTKPTKTAITSNLTATTSTTTASSTPATTTTTTSLIPSATSNTATIKSSNSAPKSSITSTAPTASTSTSVPSVTSSIPIATSSSSAAAAAAASTTTTPTTTGARSEPCAKIIPGTTLRCLEDPTFMFDPPKTVSSPPPPPPSSSGIRRLSSSSISSVPPASASPPRTIPSSSSSSSGAGSRSNIPTHHSMSSGPSKSSSHHHHHSSSIPPPRGNIRILEAPDTATLHKQSSLPSSSSSNIPMPTHSSNIPTASSSTMSSSSIDFVPPAPVAAPVKRQGVGAYQVSETPPPHAKRTTYRVLDAPDDSAIYGALPPPGGRSRASEVLDKARNRFDKFWGKTKEDEK